MHKREYLLAAVTVCIWSTLAPVNKLLINELSVNTVLCYTSFIAAVTLFLYNLYNRKTQKTKNKTHSSNYTKNDYLKMTLLGFCGIFCYNYFYNVGISRLPSQEACIINYMWPILTVLMCCILLKEHFTLRKFTAALLSTAGMIIVVMHSSSGGGNNRSFTGAAACFTAALCYAIFSAWNKKEQYQQAVLLNIAYALTAVLSAVFCFFNGGFVWITAGQFAGFLWLGAVTNALAYVLWGMAINSGNTAKVAILAYLCPFLSVILSFLLLKESVNIFSIAGLFFIIGGVLIQMAEKENNT